jgi:Flp pilus assembly protein CpaB
MEAVTPRNKIGRTSLRDVLATRNGAIATAAVAAILAGILLFAFVQHYRSSASSSSAPTAVFVAHSFIPQGSPADAIASGQLITPTTLRASEVKSGAITDPSVLHGEVAAQNIYPGQQITAGDFTASTTLASQLTGAQRAVAVPVDATHGLTGFVHTGEYVDVMASYPSGVGGHGGSVTKLLSDVLVLSAPTAASGGGVGGGNSSSDIVLRVSEQDAPGLAYAADNGKVWVVMRPPLAGGASGSSSTSGGH